MTKKWLKRIALLGILTGTVYEIWWKEFYHSYQHYRSLCTYYKYLSRHIKRLRIQVAHKKYFIRKMMFDAHFRKQVAHEQIGLVDENEYVIYFYNADEG